MDYLFLGDTPRSLSTGRPLTFGTVISESDLALADPSTRALFVPVQVPATKPVALAPAPEAPAPAPEVTEAPVEQPSLDPEPVDAPAFTGRGAPTNPQPEAS